MKKKILTYMTLTTLLLSCDFNEKLNNIIKPATAIVRTLDFQEEAHDIYDIDGLLKWMAANNILNNWNNNGDLTQNYYLYNNPESGLLNWIPWKEEDLKYNGVNVSWELIKNIISNKEYKKTYDLYVKKFIDEVFITKEIQSEYSEYYKLIAA